MQHHRDEALPPKLVEPVFWHIDRFASIDDARKAVTESAVAFEAAGVAWLMTIDATVDDHHGGTHETHVGPLHLPSAERYSMQAFSAAFSPALYSLVHHHSGVEAFYVIEGEQCLETPALATRMRKGETLAIPAGTPMRVRAIGPAVRRALAVIVHDAAQPPTMRMTEGSGPKLATCK